MRHLKNTRVPYEERSLNIGDFLWVAREVTRVVEGQFLQAKPRELVGSTLDSHSLLPSSRSLPPITYTLLPAGAALPC